jgi:CHAD domain-containing protein
VNGPAAPARQAHDVLAPTLFTLVTAARQTAARVTARTDPEAIHDFRVALRRLRTLLRPARKVFGRRHLQEIGAALGRFAKATGALRDEEVLRETLTGLELPPRARAELLAWLVQRARQERVRRRGVERLLRAPDTPGGAPSLGAALAHLERRLGKDRRQELTAEALADAAISRAFAAVKELAGAEAHDVAAMHELRIRFKRLRYTAELFAPILGDGSAAVVKSAARMQKRLGELHDVDEALLRIRRARGLDERTVRSLRRALVRARAERSERARTELGSELLRLEGELVR